MTRTRTSLASAAAVTVAGGVIAGVLATGSGPAAADAATAGPTAPRSATPEAAGQHRAACVGSWRLSIYEEPGEAPLRALVEVGADGGVIYGETAAITSLTPNVPVEYTSPGIGRWSGAGRTCAYRLLVNAADASGAYTRTSDIRGTLTVSRDGRGFAGPLTISVTHADGSRFAFTTRVTATRITV